MLSLNVVAWIGVRFCQGYTRGIRQSSDGSRSYDDDHRRARAIGQASQVADNDTRTRATARARCCRNQSYGAGQRIGQFDISRDIGAVIGYRHRIRHVCTNGHRIGCIALSHANVRASSHAKLCDEDIEPEILYSIELAFDWKIPLIGVGLAGKVNGADSIQRDALGPIVTASADITGKAEAAIALNLRDKGVDATIMAQVRSHRDREARLGRTGFP